MPEARSRSIASVGLSLGVFTETAYTVIVIVPLITSIFAAISLRIVVRDWRGTDKEQERLDREEALAKNLVVTSQRILLPSKGHPASIAAAQLAQLRAKGGALDDPHRRR